MKDGNMADEGCSTRQHFMSTWTEIYTCACMRRREDREIRIMEIAILG